MIHIDDIHSLTDFQRNTKAYVRKLKETGRPQVLTVNGKPEVVVQDAKAYQEILDQAEGRARIGAPEGKKQPDIPGLV